MKTKKLELKHLAAYLPYNVRIEYKGMKYPLDFLEVENIKYYTIFDNYKLVLRPISDLIKEIEVNGVKVIPIIELAKIEDGEMFKSIIEFEFDSDNNKYYIYYNDEFGKNTLLIDPDSTSLFTCCRGNYQDSARNQYELFQKLFEMHFDIFGLIDSGLAIDINTLTQQK